MSLRLVLRFRGDLTSLRTGSYRDNPDHDYTLAGSPADFAACAPLAGREVAVVAAEVGAACCEGRRLASKMGMSLRWEDRSWRLHASDVVVTMTIFHCPWCGGKLAEGGGA